MKSEGDKKLFEKSPQWQIVSGDPIVSSGFVPYVKNGINESEDPLQMRFRLSV